MLNKITHYSIRTLTIGALFLVSACDSSPDTGYQNIDGQWNYVIQRGLLPDLAATPLDVDNGSFEVLNQQGYAKDNTQVLFSSVPVVGADAASFKLLTDRKRESFAVDKNRAYVLGLPINGSDPDSFEVFKLNYSRDKSHIFCGTFKMEGVNPDEFEVVQVSDLWITTHYQPSIADIYGEQYAVGVPVLDCGGWGRDKQHYYYGPTRLEGVDYETFELVGEFKARDKHGMFNGRNRAVDKTTKTNHPK